MRLGSIGTRVVSRSRPRAGDSRQSGFTLLEALVALTIVLALAGVLAPLEFHARRIMLHADDRVAAQILLRALLQNPLDRAGLASLSRDGSTAGLQWRIAAEPTAAAVMFAQHSPPRSDPGSQSKDAAAQWVAYRIVASVSWAPGQVVSAETVRLGNTE
jgi:prepilin-type N-terminal cleavage/methylation domain-containing protein